MDKIKVQALIKQHFPYEKNNLSERTVKILEIFYQAGKESVNDICPHCGTPEMLCGHNGAGCSKEKDV